MSLSQDGRKIMLTIVQLKSKKLFLNKENLGNIL